MMNRDKIQECFIGGKS